MPVPKTKAQSEAASLLSPTQQPPRACFLVTDSVACVTPCPTRPTDTNILERAARAQVSNAAPNQVRARYDVKQCRRT